MLFDYPRELRTNQALVVGMHAFFVKLGIYNTYYWLVCWMRNH